MVRGRNESESRSSAWRGKGAGQHEVSQEDVWGVSCLLGHEPVSTEEGPWRNCESTSMMGGGGCLVLVMGGGPLTALSKSSQSASTCTERRICSSRRLSTGLVYDTQADTQAETDTGGER